MCAQSQLLKNDPYHEQEDWVEFRLIYDGTLLGASRNDTRSAHKHAIRKVLHPQLKRLWNTHALLIEWATRGCLATVKALRVDSHRSNRQPSVVVQFDT